MFFSISNFFFVLETNCFKLYFYTMYITRHDKDINSKLKLQNQKILIPNITLH